MWCDEFDMDLLAVLPEAPDLLSSVQGLPLWTYCYLSKDGKINNPTLWNGYHAMISFFGTGPSGFKPVQYWTDAPLVECTLLEAVRDLWVHQAILLLDGHPIWDSWRLRDVFVRLLYHRRRTALLSDEELAMTLETVRDSLRGIRPKVGEVFAQWVKP